ncbi:MAG: hypothetical protein ACJAWS_000064, partial [Oleiphilaceae bacterium]
TDKLKSQLAGNLMSQHPRAHLLDMLDKYNTYIVDVVCETLIREIKQCFIFSLKKLAAESGCSEGALHKNYMTK